MKIIKRYDRYGIATFEISETSYKKRKVVEGFERLLDETVGWLDFVGTGSQKAGDIDQKLWEGRVEAFRKLLGYSSADITEVVPT